MAAATSVRRAASNSGLAGSASGKGSGVFAIAATLRVSCNRTEGRSGRGGEPGGPEARRGTDAGGALATTIRASASVWPAGEPDHTTAPWVSGSVDESADPATRTAPLAPSRAIGEASSAGNVLPASCCKPALAAAAAAVDEGGETTDGVPARSSSRGRSASGCRTSLWSAPASPTVIAMRESGACGARPRSRWRSMGHSSGVRNRSTGSPGCSGQPALRAGANRSSAATVMDHMLESSLRA